MPSSPSESWSGIQFRSSKMYWKLERPTWPFLPSPSVSGLEELFSVSLPMNSPLKNAVAASGLLERAFMSPVIGSKPKSVPVEFKWGQRPPPW